MLNVAQKNAAEKRLQDYLIEHFCTDLKSATDEQLYFALSEIPTLKKDKEI